MEMEMENFQMGKEGCNRMFWTPAVLERCHQSLSVSGKQNSWRPNLALGLQNYLLLSDLDTLLVNLQNSLRGHPGRIDTAGCRRMAG